LGQREKIFCGKDGTSALIIQSFPLTFKISRFIANSRPVHQATITASILEETFSFDEYLQLTNDIVNEKIPRAGIYQADNTFRYTRSNLDRMNKVLENIVLNQKLYNLLSEQNEEWLWLVISEPWCGDASWGTPALCMIASASDKITFRILLRDKHPEIMKAYQTEGTDSIPKLICLRKSDLAELGSWGPRPKALHEMVLKFKDEGVVDYREGVRRLHAWFEGDMAKSIQEEMIDCIKEWKEHSTR
jgi:hypothetical protein